MSESRPLQALLFAQTRFAHRRTDDSAVHFSQEIIYNKRYLTIYTDNDYLAIRNDCITISDRDRNRNLVQSPTLEAIYPRLERLYPKYYGDDISPRRLPRAIINFHFLGITLEYQSVLKRLYVTERSNSLEMTRIGLPIGKAPQLLEGLRFVFPNDEDGVIDILEEWVDICLDM